MIKIKVPLERRIYYEGKKAFREVLNPRTKKVKWERAEEFDFVEKK